MVRNLIHLMLNNKSLLLNENSVGKLVLLFTILPFLFLCYFNMPIGDDFWYASAFIEKGFVETQLQWYQDWSGRYMASFAISTLNPVSFGYLNLAFIHPFLLIAGTVFSFRLLINTVIDSFSLGLNKLLVLSLILFFYFNYLPDFGETFYWMAGAYTYQLPVIFFTLYLNSVIYLLRSQSVVSMVKHSLIAILCLIVVTGCNEVIVVYSCFINFLILLGLFFTDKKMIVRFLPLAFILLSLSVAMIFAPGNFARGALFQKPDFHVTKSIFNALARGFFVMFFWLPILAFIMLMIPNIYKFDFPRQVPKKFLLLNKRKWVMLVLIFMLLILFIGFFPSIYTTKWIPQRAYTPIFFVFTLFATFFIFVAINKIAFLRKLNELLSAKSITSFLLITAVIALSNNSNVMNAYIDLTSGKAMSYSKQVKATYEVMTTKKNDTIFVKEINKEPLILPIRWPAKHNRLVNNEWQEYFKVNKVELE